MAEPEAVGVTMGVLAGLSAVHAAHMVHRDMKPDNVILHRPAGSHGARQHQCNAAALGSWARS
jgi:serine/threonine protein kinase